jgi:hypothetical protein
MRVCAHGGVCACGCVCMGVCVHEGVCAWGCVSLNLCAPERVCAHPLSPAASAPYKLPHSPACTIAATKPSQRRLCSHLSGPMRRPRARACPSFVFRSNPANPAPHPGSSTASPLHHCRRLSSPLPVDSLSLVNPTLAVQLDADPAAFALRQSAVASSAISSSSSSFILLLRRPNPPILRKYCTARPNCEKTSRVFFSTGGQP